MKGSRMKNDAISISWLEKLREGNEQAACRLWDHFFSQLLSLTRNQLRNSSRTMADEEDIVVSAIKSFCVGLRNGRFTELAGYDSLWRVLLTITFRKIADKHQYDHRSKRDVARLLSGAVESEDSQDQLNALLSREPDPRTAAECADQMQLLLESLKHDDLKQIALLKMEGFTNLEIASTFSCSCTSVERKLRTIRSIWSSE
jgi:DNA-directed RNA polymerase specialized sigma24 family protein